MTESIEPRHDFPKLKTLSHPDIAQVHDVVEPKLQPVHCRLRHDATGAWRNRQTEALVEDVIVELRVHLFAFRRIWFRQGTRNQLRIRLIREASVVDLRIQAGTNREHADWLHRRPG